MIESTNGKVVFSVSRIINGIGSGNGNGSGIVITIVVIVAAVA